MSQAKAVSQENVEVVQRAIAAVYTQPPDLDTVREVADPALTITTDWGADSNEHQGLEGLLDSIEEMTAAFDPWRQDLDRIVDAGPDCVVALMTLNAVGRQSGAPVEFRWAMVFSVSRGRIATARAFTDQNEALRYAGVAE